jgi:hypothetical protein
MIMHQSMGGYNNTITTLFNAFNMAGETAYNRNPACSPED